MTINTSSTVAAGSELVKRVEAAIDSAEKRISSERIARLREVTTRLNDLVQRGLVVKREYHAASAADFERLYIARKV